MEVKGPITDMYICLSYTWIVMRFQNVGPNGSHLELNLFTKYNMAMLATVPTINVVDVLTFW